jgi:hypothetical protein
MSDVPGDARSTVIRLRFVTCTDSVSTMIRDVEDFFLSHVEAVTPEGGYLGAHADTGVQERVPGYDKGILKTEIFVDLPATPQQVADFYAYLNSRLGEPYDFGAILGFVLRDGMHAKGHAICSALMVLALRKCQWFAFRLAEPAHKISPRDLYLILSATQNLTGVLSYAD